MGIQPPYPPEFMNNNEGMSKDSLLQVGSTIEWAL